MSLAIRSLRPFIGTKDFPLSCRFYRELGFEEVPLEKGFHLFQSGKFAFYLQDARVDEWIDNTMLFVEVESVEEFWSYAKQLGLETLFPGVRLKPIVERPWGKECFVHDPSGILWHFGSFAS